MHAEAAQSAALQVASLVAGQAVTIEIVSATGRLDSWHGTVSSTGKIVQLSGPRGSSAMIVRNIHTGRCALIVGTKERGTIILVRNY